MLKKQKRRGKRNLLFESEVVGQFSVVEHNLKGEGLRLAATNLAAKDKGQKKFIFEAEVVGQ